MAAGTKRQQTQHAIAVAMRLVAGNRGTIGVAIQSLNKLSKTCHELSFKAGEDYPMVEAHTEQQLTVEATAAILNEIRPKLAQAALLLKLINRQQADITKLELKREKQIKSVSEPPLTDAD